MWTVKNHVKNRKKLGIIKGRIPLKMHIILSILVENLIKMLWLNVMVWESKINIVVIIKVIGTIALEDFTFDQWLITFVFSLLLCSVWLVYSVQKWWIIPVESFFCIAPLIYITNINRLFCQWWHYQKAALLVCNPQHTFVLIIICTVLLNSLCVLNKLSVIFR